MTEVHVPASSANLGAGFDAVGVALTRHLVVRAAGDGVSERHPAARSHLAAGGDGRVAVDTTFPGGRGLGYSGAARIGGALLALHELGVPSDAARRRALEIAVGAEGHSENAAASLFGGLCVAAGGHVVRVPVAVELRVVLWVPDAETSTDQSRGALPDAVPFEDAVFNIGRASLLVAAFAAGDVAALLRATEDRLHQPPRFERAPDSRAAWEALSSAGAAAWLSGSGPTVAGLCAPQDAVRISRSLPPGGRVEIVEIDDLGAEIR